MNVFPHSRTQGFTLLELLTVIGIIAAISVSTVPAFQSFGSSQGVDQGLYDVAGLLELARNEAITRQAYVWVGFDNKTVDGQSVLCMAAVCSRDGSADSTNLVRLTRVIQVRNAMLVNWSSLKPETRAVISGSNPVSVADNRTSMVPGAMGEILEKSITFTPRGEALLSSSPDSTTPYDTRIDLSFRQTKGTLVLANSNDAAVIIDGSTGTLRQVRLQ
jgi:prepilin-type N-terminal cleavage/methylation domain-containing protein